MSPIKKSILLFVLLTCNVAIFVHGQINAELDQPFITREGTAYRDKLTIASSRSVAQFAKQYQRRENGKVTSYQYLLRHDRHNGSNEYRHLLLMLTFVYPGNT